MGGVHTKIAYIIAVVLLSCLVAPAWASGAAGDAAVGPTVPTRNFVLAQASTYYRPADAWPGSNKRARRISKRARKRTNGVTRLAALKVMKRRKDKRKKLKRAGGRDKAGKGLAPVKKEGCPG